MTKQHERRIKAAIEAIDHVVADTSVSPQDTYDSLMVLKEHIQDCANALPTEDDE